MKISGLSLTLPLALLLCACDKEPAVQIETVKAELGELTETVTATGEVESVTQVDVGTQVTGIIDKLYVDYNSVVTKGQLIAEIEKTLLQSELNSAEANVESARVTYEYNLTNYNRDKALHDKQLISDYEFQTTQKDLEVSKTSYDKAKADRVRAAKNLNYAEIYSPIDGIVISREVEVGQTVVSSMNVANLYTIADLDNMQVIGNVDEADIGRVKVGQDVTFSVDAYPDDLFEGKVTQVRLSPTTESNVVTYEVVVAAANPEHKLIPGLTANLTIYVIREQNLLLLPAQAFKFEPEENDGNEKLPQPTGTPDRSGLAKDERYVWVVDGMSLVPTVVKIGESNGIKTQILSGLSEGTSVAVGYTESAVATANTEAQRSPFAPSHRDAIKTKNRRLPTMNENKEIIRVDKLRREFMVGGERVKALRGVSFSIAEGEFVTIMGTSGSGKSTLLNLLGCLDTPTSGEYILDGVSVQSMSKNQRAVTRNRKIGFVFQNYNLLPKTTSIENVELPLLYNSSVSARERRERAVKALEAVGLQDRLYHKSNQMSGGQQQRVAIARALVNDPVIILADEATGNLDTRTSFSILTLFQELHRRGRTIIFVTHNPELALYSSRNIVLRDGKVVSDTYNPAPASAREAYEALPTDND